MLRKDKKGQYQRGSNGEKLCEVRLPDDNTKIMTKDEMYRLIDNEGKKLIFQGGVYYVVDDEVYRAVKQEEWREAKRKERNQKANEVSREKTADSNIKVSAHNETLVGDLYDNAEIVNQVTESPEECLINQERLDALYEVLATLSARDREIIQLFSLKYTDAKIGEKIGMSQRGVNKRKKAILAQMKTLLEKIL